MKNFKINLKTTSIELTEEVKKFVTDQINSIQKFIHAKEEDEAIVDCEIGKTTTNQNVGDIFKCDLNLSYHGHLFRTESTKDHLYTAIEEAVDEMIRQVKKDKEKRRDLFKFGADKIKKFLRMGN